MRAGRLGWVVAAALAVGACEPTLELTMVADPAMASSTADLSCVRSVDVYAYGAPNVDGVPAFSNDCAGIAAPGVRTIADLPLHAAVSLAIPDQLQSIYAAGIDGTAGDCTGWPVFGAISLYHGGDHVELQARPLLDCNDQVATPRTVRAIDFMQFLADQTCAPPVNATALRGWMGVMASFAEVPGLAFAGTELPFTAAATTTVPRSYRAAVGDACIALEVYDDAGRDQIACLYPDQPNPCGGTEVVYPFASAAVLDDSVDTSRLDARGGAVVVVVVDAARAPVANATVTVDVGKADVVYTRRTGVTLTASGGATTDASGTFILYAGGPVAVDIAAGGRQRHVVLGSVADFRPVPAIVVL